MKSPCPTGHLPALTWLFPVGLRPGECSLRPAVIGQLLHGLPGARGPIRAASIGSKPSTARANRA